VVVARESWPRMIMRRMMMLPLTPTFTKIWKKSFSTRDGKKEPIGFSIVLML
jgi:hypothetical protein